MAVSHTSWVSWKEILCSFEYISLRFHPQFPEYRGDLFGPNYPRGLRPKFVIVTNRMILTTYSESAQTSGWVGYFRVFSDICGTNLGQNWSRGRIVGLFFKLIKCTFFICFLEKTIKDEIDFFLFFWTYPLCSNPDNAWFACRNLVLFRLLLDQSHVYGLTQSHRFGVLFGKPLHFCLVCTNIQLSISCSRTRSHL